MHEPPIRTKDQYEAMQFRTDVDAEISWGLLLLSFRATRIVVRKLLPCKKNFDTFNRAHHLLCLSTLCEVVLGTTSMLE
jgi:hypothetical protein